jgi:hypothetical protein
MSPYQAQRVPIWNGPYRGLDVWEVALEIRSSRRTLKLGSGRGGGGARGGGRRRRSRRSRKGSER